MLCLPPQAGGPGRQVPGTLPVVCKAGATRRVCHRPAAPPRADTQRRAACGARPWTRPRPGTRPGPGEAPAGKLLRDLAPRPGNVRPPGLT